MDNPERGSEFANRFHRRILVTIQVFGIMLSKAVLAELKCHYEEQVCWLQSDMPSDAFPMDGDKVGGIKLLVESVSPTAPPST